MLTLEDLAAMQAKVRGTYVDPAIVDYSVRLVTATRSPAAVGLGDLDRYVTYGASPRASIALVAGARALAFLRGRDYVLPPDLGDLALDVLRHRLVLSYEALADDVDPDTVVTRVLSSVHGPARGAAGSVTVVTAPDRLLHHLEWHVLRRLEGRLNGAYRTNQRGAGVDLAGLREYVDTDDARRIDWSATARTGETLVREYNEDRDLTVWLVLDRSASMGVGVEDRTKADVLTELALLLARLFAGSGNRVGAVLYDGAAARVVRTGTGRAQALRIGHELQRDTRSVPTTTDLAGMLDAVAVPARRRPWWS